MIYTQTTGSGPDLVLIHGWGLNRGVWNNLVPLLQQQFRVTVVDLPGHGKSPLSGTFSLATISAELSEQLPRQSVVLGWSLGGLVALELARYYRECVAKLILIATNVCFVNQPTWPYGIDEGVLQTFGEDLLVDYQRTLARFMALQASGGSAEKQTTRQLRQCIIANGLPHQQALREGLVILRDTNKSAELVTITQPSLLIQGRQDALVPVQATEHMAQGMQQARCVVIDGAAHAPFLSHAETVVELIIGVSDNAV